MLVLISERDRLEEVDVRKAGRVKMSCNCVKFEYDDDDDHLELT